MLEGKRLASKAARRSALAQPLYHHRVAHTRIQFHSLHPPPFAAIRKGLSLTDFYSGATRLSGRFSEGLLLRRSQVKVSVCIGRTRQRNGLEQRELRGVPSTLTSDSGWYSPALSWPMPSVELLALYLMPYCPARRMIAAVSGASSSATIG